MGEVIVVEPERRIGLDADTVHRVRRLRRSGELVVVFSEHPDRWKRLAGELGVTVYETETATTRIALTAKSAYAVEWDEELDAAARRLARRLNRLLAAADRIGRTTVYEIRREERQQ